jgi:hypothetical protein
VDARVHKAGEKQFVLAQGSADAAARDKTVLSADDLAFENKRMVPHEAVKLWCLRRYRRDLEYIPVAPGSFELVSCKEHMPENARVRWSKGLFDGADDCRFAFLSQAGA